MNEINIINIFDRFSYILLKNLYLFAFIVDPNNYKNFIAYVYNITRQKSFDTLFVLFYSSVSLSYSI